MAGASGGHRLGSRYGTRPRAPAVAGALGMVIAAVSVLARRLLSRRRRVGTNRR
ncbi:MAG: hypothetical protein HOV86_24055 [Thermoactinospora sp.]|nr:hypothetical protein [Thermoactinospora sp.]